MGAHDENIAKLGGLSNPSKMPCVSWSTPATACHTGSKLAKLPGTTCHGCYALKGCYTFRSTQEAMARRLDTLRTALADGFEAYAFAEAFVDVLAERLRRTERVIARTGKPGKDDGRYFRWHDSGDLQGVRHLSLIVAIAEATPDVRHWLPTRETGYVRQYLAEGGAIPANLTVRLSVPRIGSKVPPIYRALAETPGITLSGVHTPEAGRAAGFEACPAYQNDGACGDCRACWGPRDVSYPLH